MNIEKLNEFLDVWCVWDDGIIWVEIRRDDGIDSGDWVKGKENRSYLFDYDVYSDFEMIEDYDFELGFVVRLRRRLFGGVK